MLPLTVLSPACTNNIINNKHGNFLGLETPPNGLEKNPLNFCQMLAKNVKVSLLMNREAVADITHALLPSY